MQPENGLFYNESSLQMQTQFLLVNLMETTENMAILFNTGEQFSETMAYFMSRIHVQFCHRLLILNY